MAPASKKKKKPVANPARGFATTSIASKPKSEKAENLEPVTTATEETGPTPLPITLVTPTIKVSESERELHELSPDELEKRLEESELQFLVEKHEAKSQRDALRHVAKLQTDCRLLRAQAQGISTRQLLSPQFMERAQGLAAEDIGSAESTIQDHQSRRALSEEDATVRLWTLQRALLALGFSESRIEEALGYLLRSPPADLSAIVWGSEESLDWLTLNMPEEELPGYDSQTGKTKALNAATSALDTQFWSDLLASFTKQPVKPRISPPAATMRNNATAVIPELEVSDLDSDLEPDELISVYLATKTRLFELAPKIGSSRNTTSKGTPQTVQNSSSDSPVVVKLEQKMKKVEDDVLFDQFEADSQWLLRRNQLAQENAARRRLQLPEQSSTPATSSSVNSGEASRSESVLGSDPSSNNATDDESEDDAFGDLFASTSEANDRTQVSTSDESARSGIQIRDFGQFKGISPRRVLEEACRARDPGSKFYYKLISNSAFSNRHHLLIIWTKDQDFDIPLTLDNITCTVDPRHALYKMETIATPDRQQSESLICTAALFQIFSSSTREEKAYLRLPPAFRDYWLELAARRKEQRETEDSNTLRNLRELVRQQRSLEDDEDIVLTRNFKKRINERSADGRSTPLNLEEIPLHTSMAQTMKDIWAAKSSTASYQKMLRVRSNLPMHGFRAAVIATIERNQVTIICGETGCGKSTQTPAYILEHELSQGRSCKIYCTEPRRISAITLAQRVSEEMGEHKSDVGTMRSLVGYAIRLESKTSSSTRLVYATTGIVLRMLESTDGFKDVTHIVIDEVHERSIETDFLLIILRSLISKRPELKVILMSATVDSQKFSSYFYQAPVLNVPGRTFPVATKFLEDAVELTGHIVGDNDNSKYDNVDGDLDDESTQKIPGNNREASLQGYSAKTRNTMSNFDEYRIDYALIVKLIESVTTNPQYQQFAKAVLVFLPGIAEIKRVYDMLSGSRIAQYNVIHALHSSVSSEDQQAAFTIPPHGLGKIVLSTNIAETGVTIPDITCVIDAGKHKEMRFDERRQISRLIESFISKANAKQRRGRAGRVQEGLCFHLFTKNRHHEIMADQQTPEMLRLSLQDLIMRVKICKLGDIQATLAEALDPPSAKNIRRAIDALIDVGALSSAEDLTSLGLQLSKLPLDPYLGKLVLFGSTFGCLDVSLTIAAILTSKSPFVSGIGMRSQADLARAAFKLGDSDLLTEFNAYAAWRRVCTNATSSEFQFCRKNSLSSVTLANIEDLKAQLLSSISDAGFISLASNERAALSRIHNSASRQRRFVAVPRTLDASGENMELVSAVVAWSFYPKLLAREGKGWRSIANNQAISIHPTSVIRNAVLPHVKFLSFYSILQSGGTKNYNANSLTPVSPLLLLILAGDAVFHPIAQVVQIDGARLRFALADGGWKTFVALKFLRKRLEEILERRWKKPEAELPRKLARWMTLWSDIVAEWGKRGET